MWQERVTRYLLGGMAERDEGFRKEIQRLSHVGLQVVGWVQIALALFMLTARLIIAPEMATLRLRAAQAAVIILIGAGTVLLSRMKRLYPYSRWLAMSSGLAVCAVLIWASYAMLNYDPAADDFIPGQITLVMLVGVTAIPLRPTDTLLFGLLTQAIYVLLALSAQEFLKLSVAADPVYVLFIFMLTLLATVLTAVVYDQRRAGYEAHLETIRASEELRQAEARNLLSQNAASVGRLAAALSHELNSPIGALVSGVDTLLLLAARQATSTPTEQQRLVRLQADLRKSIKDSTDRLKEIVVRMQRFTNLDKAEVQSADINAILSDVAALLEPEYKGKATVELKFETVPQLVCRPQQLSAVFSNLLNNAIDAVNGDGRISICTRQRDSAVEVLIEDNGRGVDAEDLKFIFDPGFRVTRGRVSTGNWSLFSSRQIVREHGGDIEITSQRGAGTTVRVTLPCGDNESAILAPT